MKTIDKIKEQIQTMKLCSLDQMKFLINMI